MRLPALAAALLAACAGQEGTIAIGIVTAPGSTVLDDVTRVRMVLSQPYTVVEAEREPDGSFDLVLDVIADGPSGSVLLEGYGADDTLLAYGRTPPLPIAAIDASISIYLAPPMSLAAAPGADGYARTEIGSGLLEYGVLLAGGRDADGEPTSDLVIYNAYDHELQRGDDLPAPRAGASVGTGITGFAYVFGGEAEDGEPRGTLWRFDTTAADGGDWLANDEDPSLARAGAAIAPLGSDAYLILGTPPVLLEGLLLRTSPLATPTSLGGGAASIQDERDPLLPIHTVIIGEGAGTSGIVRLSGGVFSEQAAPADALRTGHAVVATVDDRILAVGGADASGPLASVIVADPIRGRYESIADVLATPRTDAAVAATATYLVVAGGRDATGAVVADAEILDVETLAPVATLPLVVPRAGAIARALPNQQILIVGGAGADGAPVETLELFTPLPPE